VDIVLFNDNDYDADLGHVMGQTDTTVREEPLTGHLPTANDAKVLGKTSMEMINPDSIMTGVRGTIVLSTADRAKATPTLGAHGWKRPHIATKWSDQDRHVAQVITQIELRPYHGPQGPLDRVLSEIVFGCIFEMFRPVS
jgi:hypothetical protein